jgi:hypothetical protein
LELGETFFMSGATFFEFNNDITGVRKELFLIQKELLGLWEWLLLVQKELFHDL